MRQNVGPAARVIRLLLGIVLVYLAFSVAGIWVWVTGGLAAIMLVTAAAGFCPL